MASTYMEDVAYAIERAEASKSWSPRTMRYFSEGEKQMVRDRLLLAGEVTRLQALVLQLGGTPDWEPQPSVEEQDPASTS